MILVLFSTVNFSFAQNGTDINSNNLLNIPNQNSNIILNTSDLEVSDNSSTFNAVVSDNEGNLISNQSLIFHIDSVDYYRITNENGLASLNINLRDGNYSIITYINNTDISAINNIYVHDMYHKYITSDMNNNQIQSIIDSSKENTTIEFLGSYYKDVSLTISKPINLISNCGTILEGNKKSSVIFIKSDNAFISGLTLTNGLNGIELSNCKNVTIVNNTISKNNGGISLKNSLNTQIYNNTISNNENIGIFLEKSRGTEIVHNTISNNLRGIVFGLNNKYTSILYNSIKYNTFYGIHLKDSGEYSNITGNFIWGVSRSDIGIQVDCSADGLIVNENSFSFNDVAFNVGKDYRKTASGEDFSLNENTFSYNVWTVFGGDSIYNKFNVGTAYIEGSGSFAYQKRCAKFAFTKIYLPSFEQIDKNSISIKTGTNTPLLIGVDTDNGRSYFTVSGESIYHVSNGNGKTQFAVQDGNGNYKIVSLNDYTPYTGSDNVDVSDMPNVPKELQPRNPNLPSSSDNTKTPTTDNNVVNNGSSSYYSQPSSDSSATGLNGNSHDKISTPSNTESSQASSEGVTSSKSVSKQTQNAEKAIAKALNIDEETVRFIGLSALIIFIIVCILIYYMGDIKYMVNRKNEDK